MTLLRVRSLTSAPAGTESRRTWAHSNSRGGGPAGGVGALGGAVGGALGVPAGAVGAEALPTATPPGLAEPVLPGAGPALPPRVATKAATAPPPMRRTAPRMRGSLDLRGTALRSEE